ncbi:TPA: aldehyde ferredoxin oxidoreductase, partial [Candidatus Micrarchaeota archaeon]|nr:aldehyde ferredoxin oxidoreductase [Candidatus Micrarchaeota archaeon]
FYTEASQKGLVGDFKIEWGDFDTYKELVTKIATRSDEGNALAEGVMRLSLRIKGGSDRYAMHVKGLEVSAYDCHAAPAMALAYGTAASGAHHKDAWVIAWEVKTDRLGYTKDKVEKVIELQDFRGGMFESLTVCRFPWVELGLKLEYYPKFLRAATGLSVTLDDMRTLGARVYTLIRAYWVREKGGWKVEYDLPPARWFEDPLTKGPLKGSKLDRDGYLKMLSWYYELRGWDSRGIPKRSTLTRLGLDFVVQTLSGFVELAD